MNLISCFRTVLCLPGIQYLTTRFGTNSLRSWSFDEKFRAGEWNFVSETASELVQAVEQYARKGNILMLGCGTASIVGAMDPECFASFLGIDLSKEAIARANKRSNHNIRFEVGDMLNFRSEKKFSVILLSESLYYISAWRRRRLLMQAIGQLAPDGRIIVTVAQPARFAGMLRMLHRNFEVVYDSNFSGSNRRLIILH
jgi:trans-aconitate methyltransferase